MYLGFTLGLMKPETEKLKSSEVATPYSLYSAWKIVFHLKYCISFELYSLVFPVAEAHETTAEIFTNLSSLFNLQIKYESLLHNGILQSFSIILYISDFSNFITQNTLHTKWLSLFSESVHRIFNFKLYINSWSFSFDH